MSNLILLGFPNHVAERYVTLEAEYPTAIPPEWEPSYLKTAEPTDRTRIVSLDPRDTIINGLTSGIACTFDGFAVDNHNLTPGGHYRFVAMAGGEDAGGLSFHRQAPASIVSSSNITGGVGNVDEEIRTPDGSAIIPTVTTLPWEATFAWGALAETPSQGSGMACFVLRMKRVAVGAGATDPVTVPKVTVQLSEAGSPIRSLGYRAVTSAESGGQILIFPFDPSELAAPDGSNLECVVSALNGESPSGSQYAALETLSFYYEDDLTPVTFDSGWRPVEGTWQRYQPKRSFHYYPETPWTNVINFRFLMRSDQARHDVPLRLVDDAIPAAAAVDALVFVEAGVLCGGVARALELGIRKSTGPAARPEIFELAGSTAGGQSYAADAYRRRATESLDLLVTRDEAEFLRGEFWSKGKSGAFYITMEPWVAAEYQTFSAFWATVRDMSSPVPYGRYRPDGTMRFAMSISFNEKL